MAERDADQQHRQTDVGTGQYTFLLNEQGGIIDDLIVYRIGDKKFLLVVNASRADEDFAWLEKHLPNGVKIDNRSADYGGVAIQGPKSCGVICRSFQKCPSGSDRSSTAQCDCRSCAGRE